jgi:immune inhibitor A
MLVWVLFGIVMFLVLLLCAAATWFVLGPYGPPLPWRQTPGEATLVPTQAGATAAPTSGRPTLAPPAATPLPTAVPAVTPPPTVPDATAQPTVEPVPSQEPYPDVTPLSTVPPATVGAATPVPTAGTTPLSGDGTETARRLAEAQVAPRDMVDLASRLLHGGAPLPRTVTPDPEPYTVGRQDLFWLADPGLNTHREITATLWAITDHLYMYVENGVQVDQRAIEAAARTFEEEIYPATRAAFGSEWTPGVDGDPHIVILHGHFEDAAGYFSSLNEVPRAVNPYSNQREMFCMSTDALEINSAFYLSVLAHEFQHMIHWKLDPQGNTWVDEGMAQMSEQINGFDPSDLAWAFLSDTDVQLTTWADEPGESLSHYASSYLWFRYFTDRLGGTSVLSSLLDPNEDEITSIEGALEQAGYTPVVTAPRPFDAFFADWAVANYVNDSRVGDGRYVYDRGFDLDTVWPSENVYMLPWNTETTVYPYATDYVAVEAYEDGALHVVFEGDQTLPLVDTTPHSGKYFWYSNRDDQSDMTLTRAFDLREVSQATLRYWLWFDIEADYDYAYIEVSTDGGSSWSILPGQYTTDTNPNGNNFGHGYTGLSGGGRTPRWVQESLDLSAYAGREVLVRFEFITDDAYNAPGLALDDIEIPEIGFFDDAETDAGWDAQGFVWVDNTVPLAYVVQIVTETPTGKITVQPLVLDGAQHGEITLPGYGTSIVRATLVISAFAPVTTEPASYEVRLSLE